MSVTIGSTAAAGYLAEDRATLDRVVHEILQLDKDGEGEHSLVFQVPPANGDVTGRSSALVFPLSFGCDPRPAVRYLLYRMTERILNEEKTRPTTFRVVDYPVPVPLPLDVRYDRPLDVSQRIRSAVDWIAQECGKTPLVSDSVLHNVIHFFPEKLLLIAFSHPSSRIRYELIRKDRDDEVLRIQRLCEYVHRSGDRRPQVLFVASDRHHAEMIANNWT